jgi:hypothetical protein
MFFTVKLRATLAAGICLLFATSASPGSEVTTSRTTWCGSNAWIDVPSAHILVCPQGDGQTLAEVGATINVQVISDQCSPGPGMPPEDIFLVGCDEQWTTLCPPVYLAIDADAPTDENGMTTISGAIRAGGSGTGLWVIVAGHIATGVCFCDSDFICLPITVVSPDMDGDLLVGLVDLAQFAATWPPQPYVASSDFNGDGVINLIDLSLFARHFFHEC